MSDCDNVIDMAEARLRIAERKLKAQIRKNARDRSQGQSKSTKISQAMAKYGHLNGTKALERMKSLFKKEDTNETELNAD